MMPVRYNARLIKSTVYLSKPASSLLSIATFLLPLLNLIIDLFFDSSTTFLLFLEKILLLLYFLLNFDMIKTGGVLYE